MEEHFKNKLKNHTVDWDKEALLGNLQKELSRDKRKFAWMWFLLLPIFLVATCWGLNTSQHLITTSITNTTNATNATSQIEHFSEQNTNELSQNLSINQHENIIKDDQKSAEEIKGSIRIGSESRTELINTKTTSNFEMKGSSTVKLVHTIPSIVEDQDNQELDNDEVENSGQAYTVADVLSLNQSLSVDVILDDLIKRINLYANFPLLQLENLGFAVPQKNTLYLNSVGKDQSEDITRVKNRFYVSATSDIGLVTRNRKFNLTNPVILELLEENEETETSLFAIATNLNLGYQHASGLFVQSGLEYMEIREVFNYYNKTETIIDNRERDLYFIVYKMDTIFVKDTASVIRTEERTIRNYNKHQLYSIPVNMGYAFKYKKARLKTTIGLSYTFSHNYKGRSNYLFENRYNVISEKELDIAFELKDRIGIQAGLGIEYPFILKTTIFAQAMYRRSSSLLRGYTEQRYHTLSLGVGIRYAL